MIPLARAATSSTIANYCWSSKYLFLAENIDPSKSEYAKGPVGILWDSVVSVQGVLLISGFILDKWTELVDRYISTKVQDRYWLLGMKTESHD